MIRSSGVQSRYSNLRVKYRSNLSGTPISRPSLTGLDETTCVVIEGFAMPPQKGFSLLMLPVFPASQIALPGTVAVQAMLDSIEYRDEDRYIYRPQNRPQNYALLFVFSSFSSFISIRNSNPNRNQRSSNLFQVFVLSSFLPCL